MWLMYHQQLHRHQRAGFIQHKHECFAHRCRNTSSTGQSITEWLQEQAPCNAALWWVCAQHAGLLVLADHLQVIQEEVKPVELQVEGQQGGPSIKAEDGAVAVKEEAATDGQAPGALPDTAAEEGGQGGDMQVDGGVADGQTGGEGNAHAVAGDGPAAMYMDVAEMALG